MTEPTEAAKAKGLGGVYTWMGGRKQFNAMLGALLLTAAAFYLNAQFMEYAIAVGGFLGISSAATAWEDRGKEQR